MNENKTLDLEKPARKVATRTPMDPSSIEGRQLLVRSMLMEGRTYSYIESRVGVSSATISKISKELIQRNESTEESVKKILHSRLLSTASRALQKLDSGLEQEDDLKTIQGIFNSTYDKSMGTSDKSSIVIQVAMADMFSRSTASQDSKDTKDT